ncbi:hypothetical protein EYF80_010570 [Liparis tanakae]|uniref:Uncharacterized protein n=1 Tax=Liparis tanakae TaxID=230148 RepID=A0A4Z2IPI2_9TELE|nr:hypothetical protein EYF80_010570 [Liparis tanakae]
MAVRGTAVKEERDEERRQREQGPREQRRKEWERTDERDPSAEPQVHVKSEEELSRRGRPSSLKMWSFPPAFIRLGSHFPSVSLKALRPPRLRNFTLISKELSDLHVLRSDLTLPQ